MEIIVTVKFPVILMKPSTLEIIDYITDFMLYTYYTYKFILTLIFKFDDMVFISYY